MYGLLILKVPLLQLSKLTSKFWKINSIHTSSDVIFRLQTVQYVQCAVKKWWCLHNQANNCFVYWLGCLSPIAVNTIFLLRIHVRERYVRIIARCIGDIHRTFGVGSLLNGTHQWAQLVQLCIFFNLPINMCLRFGGLSHRPRWAVI